MLQTFCQRLRTVRPRLMAKARLQTDRVTAQPVLLYPEGALLLNETGAAIIQLCDGKHSFPEILALLAAAYTTSVEALEQEVSAYLFALHQQSLIELLDAPGEQEQVAFHV